MRLCRVFLIAFLSMIFACIAHADQFNNVEMPVFAQIKERQVYGQNTFDLTFIGNPKNSATKFLEDIAESKFSKENGNYIVTLEILLNHQRIVAEPIISARWEKDKFLFLTTSTHSTLEAKRDGVLLENIVIDNDTNKLEFSVKAYYSNQLNIDLSLFKEISDLSKTATVSAFVPGLASVSAAFQDFVPLLGKLLDRYKQSEIVEAKTGAFTLLDSGFGNVLNYRDSRISLNIYLKTKESQLQGSFAMGKFTDPDHELALATVKAGVGAARGRVIDIILEDNLPGGAPLKSFVSSIINAKPLMDGPNRANIRPLCDALKSRFNVLLTTRDASLLYWAFLLKYREEIQKYPDGVKCASPVLTASLTTVGLVLDPAEWPQP